MEWCAATSKHRGMRCGRSIRWKCQRHVKAQEDANHKLGRCGNALLGENGMKGGSSWRGFGVVQKVFGFCAVTIGTEVNEPVQPRIDRHEKMSKVILKLQEGEVSDSSGERWKVEGEKEEARGKSARGQQKGFVAGGFMARAGLRNIAKKENVRRQRSIA